MKKLKQSVGIDVSKDTLAVCYGYLTEQYKMVYSKQTQFSNNVKGFESLLKWAKQLEDNNSPTLYVMEATGVYYEQLAYYLTSVDNQVHVLLPNKSKHFAKSLDIKSKTDKIDAKILSRIALERPLNPWQGHDQTMLTIKLLCREYRDAKGKVTSLKNQLHAKNHSYGCPKQIIQRIKNQIKLLETQISQIECEIREICLQDELLSVRINKIATVPGLSFMTIISIISEMNGFALIENSKQLVSYCGFDVVHNESGTFKGKSKISKKGNRFVRTALYMPALSAIQFNQDLKAFYENIVERKKIKKIGVTAVARKMLILTYTLWKNDTEYEIGYKKAA